jgi:hypothetical protein
MCSAHLRQSLCCLWALLFGRITVSKRFQRHCRAQWRPQGQGLCGHRPLQMCLHSLTAEMLSAGVPAWAGRNGNAYSHVLARCAEAVAIEFVSRQHERFGRGCTMLRVRVCKASTTVCGRCSRCETHGRSRRAPPRERLCLHIQRCPSISAPACDQQSRPHSAPEPHVTRLVYNLTKTDRAHPLMQSRSGIQREGSCQLWHTA